MGRVARHAGDLDRDVRRNALSDFVNVMPNGIAMKVPNDGMTLVNARICAENDDVMLVASEGQSVRMPLAGISFRSRSAGGVNVFNVEDDQYVVSVAHMPAGDIGGEDDENGESDAAPVGPAEEAREAADGA